MCRRSAPYALKFSLSRDARKRVLEADVIAGALMGISLDALYVSGQCTDDIIIAPF